jgi:hypothetical protein
MTLKTTPLILLLFTSCARFEVYYPSDGKSVVTDERGRPVFPNRKALIMHGADSLGSTVVDVSRGGIRFSSAGGIDTSTSTLAGYRTVRYGIGAAAWAAGAVGVANVAANAYGANQAAAATSNAAASRGAAATAASNNATTIRLAEIAAAKEAAAASAAANAAAAAKALPAAGSTIPSVIPSVVTPVP